MISGMLVFHCVHAFKGTFERLTFIMHKKALPVATTTNAPSSALGKAPHLYITLTINQKQSKFNILMKKVKKIDFLLNLCHASFQ